MQRAEHEPGQCQCRASARPCTKRAMRCIGQLARAGVRCGEVAVHNTHRIQHAPMHTAYNRQRPCNVRCNTRCCTADASGTYNAQVQHRTRRNVRAPLVRALLTRSRSHLEPSQPMAAVAVGPFGMLGRTDARVASVVSIYIDGNSLGGAHRRTRCVGGVDDADGDINRCSAECLKRNACYGVLTVVKRTTCNYPQLHRTVCRPKPEAPRCESVVHNHYKQRCVQCGSAAY